MHRRSPDGSSRMYRPGAQQCPLTQLGYGVGGASDTVEQAEEEWEAQRPAARVKVGYINHDGSAHIGVGHGGEVFKVRPAGIDA